MTKQFYWQFTFYIAVKYSCVRNCSKPKYYFDTLQTDLSSFFSLNQCLSPPRGCLKRLHPASLCLSTLTTFPQGAQRKKKKGKVLHPALQTSSSLELRIPCWGEVLQITAHYVPWGRNCISNLFRNLITKLLLHGNGFILSNMLLFLKIRTHSSCFCIKSKL